MVRSSIGRSIGALGIGAIIAAGGIGIASGASQAAPAKPAFTPGIFKVVSVQGTTLNVTDKAGKALALAVTPSTGLRHRFNGAFHDLAEIQTRDRVQVAYQPTGQGTGTADLIQDHSLQVAHTEVKGTVDKVAKGGKRFTLTLTAVYGGKDAAFKVGKKITVDTANPASVPVTYLQGGPTCGNASCLATGLTLELYGLSDRPHRLVERPQGIVQVEAGAAQVVHAATDDTAN